MHAATCTLHLVPGPAAVSVPGSPVACDVGPIAIVEGRHPVIETREEMSFQSNDTYMAEASSFHIITGPNMAGKSTYLRQVLHTLPDSAPGLAATTMPPVWGPGYCVQAARYQPRLLE